MRCFPAFLGLQFLFIVKVHSFHNGCKCIRSNIRKERMSKNIALPNIFSDHVHQPLLGTKSSDVDEFAIKSGRFPHSFSDFIPSLDKVFPSSSLPLLSDVKDNSIMFWDSALSPIQCIKIIQDYEASDDMHYAGGAYINGEISYDPLIKKNTELYISEESDSNFSWYNTENLLVETVRKYLNFYQDANIILATQQNPLSDEGFRLKKYLSDGSEHHAYHSDTSHERKGDTTPRRIIAVLLYLNTVHEGGETVFINQNIAVQPVVGRIVMFPTSYTFVHAGRAPISNSKYVVINFLTI